MIKKLLFILLLFYQTAISGERRLHHLRWDSEFDPLPYDKPWMLEASSRCRVPVSLLNVKRTPLKYQCEECDVTFVYHQAFTAHNHKHVGIKRKHGDLPDAVIVELVEDGDMDSYASSIASSIANLFREFEKGFKYQIDTVVNIRHGLHTEKST